MTGLVYARARWYDPVTGSFLSPDPMGYRDSSNLYAFAGGDPVNGRDPTGEYDGGSSLQVKAIAELMWEASPYGLPISAASVSQATAQAIRAAASAAAVPVLVGAAGGALANWSINAWADLTDLKGDEYEAQRRLEDTRTAAQSRENAKLKRHRLPGVSPHTQQADALGDDSLNVDQLVAQHNAEIESIAEEESTGAGSNALSSNPILSTQKEISVALARKVAAVDRWLSSSGSRLAVAYRKYQVSNPNFASLIRGRVIDRRMNRWFQQRYGDEASVRIDQTIPGSGANLRPDIYFPKLGGKRVVFDVGGKSKVNDVKKYDPYADVVIPVTY